MASEERVLKLANHMSVHSIAGFLETFQNEVLFGVKISMVGRIREIFFPLKDLISQSLRKIWSV